MISSRPLIGTPPPHWSLLEYTNKRDRIFFNFGLHCNLISFNNIPRGSALVSMKLFGLFQSFLSSAKVPYFWLKLDLHCNMPNFRHVSNTSGRGLLSLDKAFTDVLGPF